MSEQEIVVALFFLFWMMPYIVGLIALLIAIDVIEEWIANKIETRKWQIWLD